MKARLLVTCALALGGSSAWAADDPRIELSANAGWVLSDGVKGSTTVVVPDVIGLKIPEASHRLIDLGFVIDVSGEFKNDPAIVMAQSAVPGSVAERGATVTIYVGYPLPTDG